MGLVSELRTRVTDIRHCMRAFGLAVVDETCTSAIAELTNGHLIVLCAGGPPQIDIDLRHSLFNTVGKVYQSLERTPGFRVSLDEDVCLDHDSLDLQSFGPTNILGTGVDLVHHRFSDTELESFISSAVTRHNPSFTIQTVPPAEATFVLTLAHANVCRVLATDATKRKGMDQEIFYLLELANSLERSYDKDVKRLRRALQSPKEAPSNDMAEGDIVIGSFSRFSLRTGKMTPNATNLPPMPAELLPIEDEDIEDERITVRWKRNRDTDFYSIEIWCNHVPDVERLGNKSDSALASASISKAGTSKCVFSTRANVVQTPYRASRMAIGGTGQAVTSYPVDHLEPETEYYFRAYIFDLNGEASASEVESAVTKAFRSKLSRLVPLMPAMGPAGTVVTVELDPERAPITAAHVVYLGVKTVTPTIIDGFHFTFVVPTFSVKDAKDLCIVSPNGLVDTLPSAFTVTAT